MSANCGFEVLATEDPERFTVLFGDGRVHTATLAHRTRRGLALHGVPPVQVARELVALIVENDRWPESDDEVVLAAVAGAMPGGFTEELRSRLG
ncbi:MAG: hypothetical protein WEB03_09005 [Nitriliruptor sp.]|uniref:hypothetical protein n=1 Tax=Nitriliruptor sp. TaxID=2448056 RepID=UPI0034A01CFE